MVELHGFHYHVNMTTHEFMIQIFYFIFIEHCLILIYNHILLLFHIKIQTKASFHKMQSKNTMESDMFDTLKKENNSLYLALYINHKIFNKSFFFLKKDISIVLIYLFLFFIFPDAWWYFWFLYLLYCSFVKCLT